MTDKLTKRAEKFDRAADARAAGIYPYYRAIASGVSPVVRVGDRDVLMFGSNSYLGLNDHEEVKEAAKAAIARYGTGCGGSRLLNGTLDLHEELEERLARFLNRESAVVFASGYQANVGALSAVLHRHDVLIHDERNHASLIDGGRLGYCRTTKFAHNDTVDLEATLRASVPSDPSSLQLVAVDSVFSMEGDLAPLDRIVQICAEHSASLMVDEAHALGVIGPGGRGAAFGARASIVMGTFSKSLASIGGFIAADRSTVELVKHQARALVFSASLSPANTASALAALTIVEREPSLIAKLHERTAFARHTAEQHGLINAGAGSVDVPILPIDVGADELAFALSARLLEEGVFVNPVIAPAVARGSAILRFSVMATHSEEQIDHALRLIARCKHETEAGLDAA